jgi:hypothetical protein
VSARDQLHAALLTALRRMEAVVEDASPLAAASALEAASGAATLLSRDDGEGVAHPVRQELLKIMQQAALLMRSLSRR